MFSVCNTGGNQFRAGRGLMTCMCEGQKEMWTDQFAMYDDCNVVLVENVMSQCRKATEGSRLYEKGTLTFRVKQAVCLFIASAHGSCA
jgi:hypothetical protein